jgi:hypothetical protein
MRKYVTVAVLAAILSVFLYAHALPQKTPLGSAQFSPTRIDWLTTTLQANLREELTQERRFSMDLTFNGDDPDTVVIYVRYLGDMAPGDRKIMNMDIETARNVINTTVRRYGWESWVKIKEDIKPSSKQK